MEFMFKVLEIDAISEISNLLEIFCINAKVKN